MELIDKSDLVAVIERIRTHEFYLHLKEDEYAHRALDMVLESLNTIEVKEVNLEKELENLIEKEKAFVTDNREVKYYNGDSFNHIYELEFIAKHFFELGLKTKKRE